MIRIWAKVLKRDKIEKQFVLSKDESLSWGAFFDYLTEICYALDIPTPVLLKTHVFNFAKFNFVRFIKSDFLENVPFDKLVLENIADK